MLLGAYLGFRRVGCTDPYLSCHHGIVVERPVSGRGLVLHSRTHWTVGWGPPRRRGPSSQLLFRLDSSIPGTMAGCLVLTRRADCSRAPCRPIDRGAWQRGAATRTRRNDLGAIANESDVSQFYNISFA